MKRSINFLKKMALLTLSNRADLNDLDINLKITPEENTQIIKAYQNTKEFKKDQIHTRIYFKNITW